MNFSGIQLATGTTIDQPQMFGPPKMQKVESEPLAALTLLSVLAGTGLSFVRPKIGTISSACAAGLIIILLAALKSKLDGDAVRQSGGTIEVSAEAGFYLSVILMLAAVRSSAYVLFDGVGHLAALQKSGGDRFCTQCGARNAPGDLFCKECGTKLA